MPTHDHDHSLVNGHSHSHEQGMSSTKGSAFRWSVLLNSGLSGLQIVIGIGFGSLALISDAIHNLGDVAGLLLAWGAERLSDRPASGRFTYGFGRSTQLAALINATLILMASAVVIVEGLQRLRDPQPISSTPVIWAATAGILVNLFSARLFGHDHGQNLNRKAAVVHLLTDAAVSAAVLLSAVLVSITGWDWIDPFTAVGVGLAVAWSGWGLMREAVLVNLDGVPRPIELDLVRQTLQELPGVETAHHLHIWAMSTSRTALTAHLRCRNNGVSDTALLAQARERLAELGIDHSTLELEWMKPGEPSA